VVSDDGRERPWRATITGSGTRDTDPAAAEATGAAAVLAASIQLDQLIRPLIAATREDHPDGRRLVSLALHAFPRIEWP
jgi:hypothetical protein